MSVTEHLAYFVSTAEPHQTLQTITAPAIADCFGCILAGANSEVATRVQSAFVALAEGHAPVFGTNFKLPAPHAALANAVAGHAWDLDDWEEPANTHPTVVLLPALLALAGTHPASGKDLLTAYSVGAETIMRLGEALTLDHYARGFHSTATLGAIGASASGSRLLGLSPDQTAHALAIAVSQATGYTLQFGSDAKPLQAGFAARIGVEAALLAAQGVTGQPQTLGHPRGFSGLMGNHNNAHFDDMLARLGDPWALDQYGLVLKPWPSCGYTHRLLTIALDLRDQVLPRLPEVAAIHVTMPDFHYEILPFDAPTTRAEALFSAPACLAQGLVYGQLTLADSAAGFWRDPQVARLMSLTTVTPETPSNPDLNYDPEQPDCVTITLASGESLTASCPYPLGAPTNSMPQSHLAAKFADITGRDAALFNTLLQWPNAPDIAHFFKEIAS